MQEETHPCNELCLIERQNEMTLKYPPNHSSFQPTSDNNLALATAETHHGEILQHFTSNGAGSHHEPPLRLHHSLKVLAKNGDLTGEIVL